MVAPLPRRERVTLLDRGEDSPLPLTAQADLLGLNRSGLYYKPRSPSGEDLRLKRRIDELFTEHPFYGARRIAAVLNGEGFHVDRKNVGRNMREMGLHAVYPHRDGSRPHPEHPVYPYLLRDLEIREPDQVWGTDITYVRLRRGWMYLVAFMDWHSRYVISWELDQTLELSFVLQALRGAFDKGHRPGILNSDQGSHFTSRAYIALAEERGTRISMDGRGRCVDNIFTERLWRSYKYEEVYLNEYDSPAECRRRAYRYFEFYNNRRPHQSLGYRTPAEVYFSRSGEQPCLSAEREDEIAQTDRTSPARCLI